MTLTQIKPAGLSKPVDLADNEQIRLGTGNDLIIQHTGSRSEIHNSTGDLLIRADSLKINNAGNTEELARFTANGAVELYYDNVKRFETTSYGNEAFGHFGVATDNAELRIGGSYDLKLYHTGSHSFIDNNTGDLYIRANGDDLILRSNDDIHLFPGNGDSGINVIGDGAVELYWNNSKKFETYQYGIRTTQNIDIGTHAYWGDNGEANFGASQDLKIYHNGTASFIENNTGDLKILSTGTVRLRGDNVAIQNNAQTETMAFFAVNGATKLYYDNVKKFETTSTGIKVDSTSDAIIDLHHNNSTAHCRLNFSNNNGDAHGGVWYSASSNMEFRTSNNERLRITSSGQIWKRQDPVNRTALKTYTGGEGLMFDHYQLQDSGTYIRYSDIVSIGDGSQGSAMRLLTMPNSGTPQERLRIHPTGEVTIPAGVTLGTAIGSNTSSNTLDDYEEGTWTPVPTLTYNPGGRSITAASGNEGIYVKIGRFVHVEYKVGWTAISGSGYFNVGASGLPYAADGTVHVVSGTARSNQTGYTFVAEGLQNSQINVFRRYDNGGPNENDVMYGFATYQTS